MHYGFRIVEDMIDGLSNCLDEKGFATRRRAARHAPCRASREWGDLDLNYKVVAEIDPTKCIGCQLCYVACEDGAHQSIAPRARRQGARGRSRTKCVGCNLCMLVCPVPGCITMDEIETGRAPQSWRAYQEALGKGVACEPPGERPQH